MRKIIALAGTPNCGKTTLFNLITKSRGAVGNRPGVTVEKKYGALRQNPNFAVVDLPGTYSLSSQSPEERTAGEFIASKGADCIAVVIDGAHPEHGIFLLLEILSTGIPTVAAINFADEIKRRGGFADVAALSSALKIPCFLISARQNTGVSSLISAATASACSAAPQKSLPRSDFERRRLAKELCTRCFSLGSESKIAESLDRFFSESRFSFFACAAAVLTVLILAFGFPVCVLTDLIDEFFSSCSAHLFAFLCGSGFSEAAAGVLAEGALASFGKVISFLPQLALLFFFISLLEESGYLARAAFVTDKALRRFGLGGFAVIPLLLGLGCTVPAALAAKAAQAQDRRRLISVLPFVPCSAKLPVYAFFAAALFRRAPWLFITAVYLTGISVGAAFCFITRKNASQGFLLELPPLRFPSIKSVLIETALRCRAFAGKAASVIVSAGIFIWLLSHLDSSFLPVTNPCESVLYMLGSAIEPLFAPIGIGREAIIALACGVFAKEACLSVLLQLGGKFTTLSALSFVIFFTFYTPCIAALIAIWRQSGTKTAVRIFLFQTALAYALSFAFYQTASAACALIR